MWWENAPENKVLDVVVFEGPDVLAEFGGVFVISMAEWCGVVSVSCFEVILCESYVRFWRVVVFACDGGLVNYWWLQAASFCRCGKDAFVMVVDYLFRVVHAAVTDLDGVSVEDFLSLWSLGKCLSTRARNLCPMLVLVFLLKGGLYQRMLLCCRFFRLHVLAGSYCSV